MSAQHMDPLVFNAFTGKWQNASNANASGNSLGLQIGAFDGSAVTMLPAVGNTIQIDGGLVGTIESAYQMQSGAASEDIPAFATSIVFNPGAANEQLSQLTVSGLASSSAQAVLMTSESADGTIHGSVRHGTLVPGTTYTYNFTSMHMMFPHSQLLQLGTGYNLVATDPRNAPNGESWHAGNLQNGWTGRFDYTLIPVGSGLAVFCEVSLIPGTVADGTNVTFVSSGYQPSTTKRLSLQTDGGIKSTGTFPSLRITSDGFVDVYGVSTSSTFLTGTGVYSLGV